jgi:hypothetical protein
MLTACKHSTEFPSSPSSERAPDQFEDCCSVRQFFVEIPEIVGNFAGCCARRRPSVEPVVSAGPAPFVPTLEGSL